MDINTLMLLLALTAVATAFVFFVFSHRRNALVAGRIGFSRHTDPVAAYRAVVASLDAMGEGLMIIENQRFTFVNDALCRLSGYSREELLELPGFERLFYGSERSLILRNHKRRLAGEHVASRYETVLRHRSGAPIEAEISISVLKVEGRAAAVVAARDIRERKQADDELRLHRDRLQELVDLRTAELALEKEWAQVTLQSIGDAVITTDARGIVSYLSPAAEQLTGWQGTDAIGQHLGEVVPILDEVTGRATPDPVAACLARGRIHGLDCQSVLVPRCEQPVAIELSAAPIHDHAGAAIGAVIVLHDVSEQRRLNQKLSHQATHDALTGLINRFEFEQRLQRLVDGARTSGEVHAVCYMDLDQFKVVNDTCGHIAGDELLRQLSGSLRQRMRRTDTLGRLGGDEFGILLEACEPDQAVPVAQALLDAIHEFEFVWQDKRFKVGASIGVVTLGPTTENLIQVMRAADAACYTAKEKGRNRVHLYQENDVELARRHGEMQWVTRLRGALEHNRFRLFYQRITPLSDEGLSEHCEILIRLLDVDGQLVPPGAFIPAAERYNLMAEIDRWVIGELIAWYARTASADPLRELPVFCINLSGTTLSDPSLVQYIRETLALHKVAPQSLCFEITETATVANLTEAMHLISHIRQLGCSFALDDFGIGMSSFAYLKNLPVDFLKIDGNFVRDILTDPVDDSMVDAINRMGHVMAIQTIAEYVENDAIRARLTVLGIDYGQGFGISVPRPLEEFR